MRRAILVALGTGCIITSAAAITIGAAVYSGPESLAREHYEASLRGVVMARDSALSRCEQVDGAEREVCRAEATGYEMVRAAEIEADYRRTQQAGRAAQRARIEARYQLERARCQAVSGFKRDKCLIAAHAAKGRAMLDAAAPYDTRL